MVLIIGATGFIGMYTTQAFLKAGKKVIATGRNKTLGRKLEEMGAEFLPLDITNKDDFDKLPKEGVEGVVVLSGKRTAKSAVKKGVDVKSGD